MPENKLKREDVHQFILSDIESVSHLEALFLLWRHRPNPWTVEAMAHALYVSPEFAIRILRDLVERNLIATNPDAQDFYYDPMPEKDALLEATDEVYRKELVRISNLIHSKAPRAVRDFARAFRFTKERD